MKQILFVIAIMCTALWCSAQNGQVAVLYHDSDFKTFYSSSAFKDAMANAVDGDVVTLSPGTYEASDITKAVTIRGAGIGDIGGKSNEFTLFTSISGDVAVTVPVNEQGYSLSIEGIEFKDVFRTTDVQDAVFSKIRFNKLYDGYFSGSPQDPCGRNLTFFHCLINYLGSIRFGFNLNNCVIDSFGQYDSYKNMTYSNCIINMSATSGSGYNSSHNMVLKNCLLISEGKCYINYSSAYNCLWVGPYADKGAFQGDNSKPERHNSVVPEGTDIFVEGSFYELNEAGKKYLGNDGTQVGLYGTDLPFSTKTSYPRIKKLKVAPESTSDGKLKIEFELDADI